MIEKRTIVIVVGLIGLAALLGKRRSSPTPTPAPRPAPRPAPSPAPSPAPRTGEAVFAVPEIHSTDRTTSGVEKAGYTVLYVPSVQASGSAVGTRDTSLPNAGAFFQRFGAPTLYWSDLNQWEWGQAPVPIWGFDQDRRAYAAVNPRRA